jgi:hypothetical protein
VRLGEQHKNVPEIHYSEGKLRLFTAGLFILFFKVKPFLHKARCKLQTKSMVEHGGWRSFLLLFEGSPYLTIASGAGLHRTASLIYLSNAWPMVPVKP